MVLWIGTSLFSPILNPFTSVLNLLPSSYCPGAYEELPGLAKVLGLEGEDPKLILGDFVFVIASALS